MDGTWLFSSTTDQSGPQLESGTSTAAGRRSPSPTRGTSATTPTQSFARRRRLVPQGLPPAERGEAARRGSCASSRSTTARRSGSTASRSARTRGAYLPFEIRLPGRAAQARRRQPPGHPRRQPPQADRLPALGPVDRRQADRRLVELRRPAARGLPAQDRRRRLQHGRRCGPTCRARRCTATVTYRVHAAQLRLDGPARRRERALRRPPLRHRHGGDRRQALRHASPSGSRSRTRGCGRRPARTSTTRRWPSARAATCSSATRSQTGVRSIKVVDGHLLLNGAPLNFRGVGAPRGLARRRASRSTTRRATSSWRGSRSWARP